MPVEQPGDMPESNYAHQQNAAWDGFSGQLPPSQPPAPDVVSTDAPSDTPLTKGQILLTPAVHAIPEVNEVKKVICALIDTLEVSKKKTEVNIHNYPNFVTHVNAAQDQLVAVFHEINQAFNS